MTPRQELIERLRKATADEQFSAVRATVDFIWPEPVETGWSVDPLHDGHKRRSAYTLIERAERFKQPAWLLGVAMTLDAEPWQRWQHLDTVAHWCKQDELDPTVHGARMYCIASLETAALLAGKKMEGERQP